MRAPICVSGHISPISGVKVKQPNEVSDLVALCVARGPGLGLASPLITCTALTGLLELSPNIGYDDLLSGVWAKRVNGAVKT